MGKAQRRRQKLHAPAAKSGKPPSAVMAPPVAVPEAAMLPPATPGGVFAGLQIPSEALQQRLPDFDARSVRSGASNRSTKSALRGQPGIKKRDKRKIRRQVFLDKLDAVMETLKSARAEKRRRATAVVGDMRPLAAALPDSETLEKEKAARKAAAEQRRQPSQKRRGMPKKKRLHKQYLEDVAHFQQVLDHPIYREDPEGIVSEHIHQWVIKDAHGMDIEA